MHAQNSVQMMRKFTANVPASHRATERRESKPQRDAAENRHAGTKGKRRGKQHNWTWDSRPEIGVIPPLTGLGRGYERECEQRSAQSGDGDNCLRSPIQSCPSAREGVWL